MSHSTRLALREARGPLNELTERLSGVHGHEWLAALKRFLRKEDPWPTVESLSLVGELTTWKTVTIDTSIGSYQEFRDTMERKHLGIDFTAHDILKRVLGATSYVSERIDLARVSVADLGFASGACLHDIYKQAAARGLELCAPGVGPHLRLQYKDQPRGEWLIVAMEGIRDFCGYPRIFGISHEDDGRLLSIYGGAPGDFWFADCVFVFRRARAENTTAASA